jgi:hypothetical protein
MTWIATDMFEVLHKQSGCRKIKSFKDMKFKQFKMETRDNYRAYPIKLRELNYRLKEIHY